MKKIPEPRALFNAFRGPPPASSPDEEGRPKKTSPMCIKAANRPRHFHLIWTPRRRMEGKSSSGGFKSAIQDSNSSLILEPKSRTSANVLFFLCGPVGASIARMSADVAFGIRVISRCIVHERTNAWDCACLRSAADGHPRRRCIIIAIIVITIIMTIRVNAVLLYRWWRR